MNIVYRIASALIIIATAGFLGAILVLFFPFCG